MLKEIDIKSINFNAFSLIGDEWMIIAAGNKNNHNMMTASWGGLGVLWNKNVATIYVRPSRYTLEFLNTNTAFSLNFFGDNKALHKIGGAMSGRNIDKTKAANLTTTYQENTVFYQEAKLVLICKKLYFSEFNSQNFLSPDIESFYPLKDYHNIFIGEIVKALIQ